MMNSKPLFKTLLSRLTGKLQAVPSSLVIIVLVVSLLGFADASYLTIEHYQNAIPPCTIVNGCEKVLTSAYATVFGVPVALCGAIYYLLIMIGAFAYLEGKNERMLRYALYIILLGFIGTLWFVSLQVFVLKAYCLYCLGSALTTTILFILSIVIFKKYGNNPNSGTE